MQVSVELGDGAGNDVDQVDFVDIIDALRQVWISDLISWDKILKSKLSRILAIIDRVFVGVLILHKL